MVSISNNRLIISRTDSIGDVMLTLPLAGYLKTKFPELQIIFLGTTYTRPVLECCEHIDKVICWDEIKEKDPVAELKELQAGCILHVFPRPAIAKAAKGAGIPVRVGTSHRLYHWTTCNKLPGFTRKGSELHEAQLNFKLLKGIGIDNEPKMTELKTWFGFRRIKPLRADLQLMVDTSKRSVVLHPGSRGSAAEWGVGNFSRLTELLPADKVNVFITGTEKEGAAFAGRFSGPHVTDLSGKLSLDELISFINHCDGLVASSTGPLHLAAVMGKRAVGIYPAVRPIHPGRWAPIGENAITLQAKKSCKHCGKGGMCECLSTVKPEEVAEALKL